MKLSVVLCHLRHPPKPNYAGWSPAHLVEATGYDPRCDPVYLQDELYRELRSVRLDRQAIVLRLRGSNIPLAHEQVLLKVLAGVGCYSGTQAIVWHAWRRNHAVPPFRVGRPSAGYPWADHWTQQVPFDALEL